MTDNRLHGAVLPEMKLPMARCCFIGSDTTQCSNDAEWEVFYGPQPDGSTLACSVHVGDLCADDYSNSVVALTDGQKWMWADRERWTPDEYAVLMASMNRSEDGARRWPANLVRLTVEALGTDGSHHKQWYLWKLACILGMSEAELDQRFERGMAP